MKSNELEEEAENGDVNQQQNDNSEKQVTFVDFIPTRTLFGRVDRHSDLIQKVNAWLRANPQWQAKTIETIPFNLQTSFGKEKLYIRDNEHQNNQHAVRLWVQRKEEDQGIQQMKVLHVIPRIKITGHKHETFLDNSSFQTNSGFVISEFETIDEILVHLNSILTAKEFQGKILNIETVFLPIRSNQYTVNIEELSWPKEDVKGVLSVLRVYCDQLFPSKETVEILDFLPKVELWNAPLAVPNLESFTNLLKNASGHLKKLTFPYRFLSCTTVCCPTSTDFQSDFIDSRRTFYPYKEWTSLQIFSARFVRIALARPIETEAKESLPTIVLNCKIFVPFQKEDNSFRKINEMKEYIEKWFMKKNVQILSIETETICSTTSLTSSATLIDTCLQMKKLPNENLIAFKVYVNGHYSE